MSDFRSSSQRERWIFQPHDLVERWTAANQRAATYLAHVGSYGTTRLKVDEHGCSDNPPDRGYSYNIFQEILSTLVCYGASPKAYYANMCIRFLQSGRKPCFC